AGAPAAEDHAGLIGLRGSAVTAAAAYLAREAAARGVGPLVYLAADASTLDDAREDFAFLLELERVAHFPDSGVEPYDLQIPRARQRAARIETLARLLPEGDPAARPWVVLTTPDALFRRVPDPRHFARGVQTLRVGERWMMEDLFARLVRLGYQPQPLVGEYGDFSRRGGIVDVYGFGYLNPVRIEFDDDEIVSLREFDVFSQRSKAVLQQFTLLPLWEIVVEEEDWARAQARGAIPADGPLAEHLGLLRGEGSFEGIEWMPSTFGIPVVSLLDFAGPGAFVVADDPLLLEARWESAREAVPSAEELAASAEETPLKRLFSPPAELFIIEDGIGGLTRGHPVLHVGVGARRPPAEESAPREKRPRNKGWTAGEQLHPPDPLEEVPRVSRRAAGWREILARSSARRGELPADEDAADGHAGGDLSDDAAGGGDAGDGAAVLGRALGDAGDDAAGGDGAHGGHPGGVAGMRHAGRDAAAVEAGLIEDGHAWSDVEEQALLLPYATRYFTLPTQAQERFGRNLALTRDYIARLRARGLLVTVLCDTSHHRERLEELMEGVPASFAVGNLAGGFAVPELGLAVLTDHEIFERLRRRRAGRRFSRGISLKELLAMRPGDFVVHIDHGIGAYRGIERLPVDGQLTDCMKIEYAAGDKLFIPVDQLNLVQKYAAEEGHRPVLSRLGSGQWARTKAKVKKSIKEMAGELMRLYAQRKTRPGYGFPPDTVWQTEMEARFPYEETSDQLKAIEEVKEDMERPAPMDRLVCGDVGFGKTEVAIRAAFKCVMDGKQAVMLVPTTLLAQQHYDTVRERLKGYPVRVEMLSRFRSTKEIGEALAALAAGRVDVVVGTHRLLSRDVRFKDLGLIIVDEEQRFGVRHKERLKQLRTQVDVLTLTATPIPRTLNMALMGARDMSTIHTPPRDRRPIQTEIVEFGDEVIAYALMREADRGGQSFFVHNRVESIDALANYLRGLVPHLRIAVGHGQMRERQLEEVMRKFLAREYDVLVATMIIESGLDMPNVNTILVNRTDTLGLAQLYQLRGRVGRSARKAYAYLLVPPARVITEQAMKRLKAI
ncbi:MAG: DEAD/DEAH box helicase, partial [Candidatus Eisenbacteria bacterium]|nr:DEAD/DEAH box helicase [Candidatus Eisenbacteria bacterium]